MAKGTAVTTCSSCHEPVEFKTDCVCHACTENKTASSIARIVAIGIVSISLCIVGSCFICEHTEIEKFRAIQQIERVIKVETNQHGTKIITVEPKPEEPKKEPTK